MARGEMQSGKQKATLVSEADMKRIVESFHTNMTQERECKRRKHAAFTLTVGTCRCGGEIVYHSEWVLAVPMTQAALGSQNPLTEKWRCSCAACGILYDREYPLIQKVIQEYKDGA